MNNDTAKQIEALEKEIKQEVNMEKDNEYHVCSKEKGYCRTLEKYCQPSGHVKGMSFFDVLNRERKKIITKGVVYRENSRDNGILFNFCPFCGADLRPFRGEDIQKEAGNE
jgi:hypothetical protein